MILDQRDLRALLKGPTGHTLLTLTTESPRAMKMKETIEERPAVAEPRNHVLAHASGVRMRVRQGARAPGARLQSPR